MKNQAILYGIIGFLAGILIGIYLTTNAVNNNASGMMQMMGIRNTTGNVNRNMMNNSELMDAHFIEQMIPHHEDAITMAEIARTKAQREDIKVLAEAIITAQQKEINEMTQWYKNWYGRELPTGDDIMSQHGMMGNSDMHMGMMGNETDMSRLENAEEFDKVFIEEMIPHHQMAVMMASMLKNGTQREEMRKLADDIITSQTKEIDQMRSWYQSWY